MYCTDFEYAGKRLSDYGCIVCHISGSSDLNTVNMGSQITFNTVNLPQQNKFKIMSTQYSEAYTTTFEICKFNCNNRDDYKFSQEEISALMRWLNKKNYNKFKMIYKDGECSNVYYMGTFNVQMITHAGDIVGLELTLQTNAPFGYYEPVEYVMDFSNVNDEFSVYDMSDEIGYIYPNSVTIECSNEGYLPENWEELGLYKNEGLLEINNSKDGERKTIINACVNGEVLTLDCENKIITSSEKHDGLYNDFNYNFIRISNSEYDTENTFTVNKPCKITFTYSPICKMGIV